MLGFGMAEPSQPKHDKEEELYMDIGSAKEGGLGVGFADSNPTFLWLATHYYLSPSARAGPEGQPATLF